MLELMTKIRQNASAAGLIKPGITTESEPNFEKGPLDNNIPTTEDMVSDASDVESTNPDGYTTWPREGILFLISLYKKYDSELENPLLKKKDIWKKITAQMNANSYKFSQNKVESKWRSLLKSHKDFLENKTKTGSKRKTFQFFDEINDIVGNRHDIEPPVVAGSMCPQKPYTELMDKNEQKTVMPVKEKRERKRCSTDSNEVVDIIRSMEESRKAERAQREEQREKRAKERNDILREFLDVLKK